MAEVLTRSANRGDNVVSLNASIKEWLLSRGLPKEKVASLKCINQGVGAERGDSER